jgi:hypothetical protein
VTARLQPPDLAGSSGAAVQPPIVDAASDEGSRGPDITVTIGHIEVRAAQAPPASPAKPARPPFRPQVSLADFLNGSTKGSRR